MQKPRKMRWIVGLRLQWYTMIIEDILLWQMFRSNGRQKLSIWVFGAEWVRTTLLYNKWFNYTIKDHLGECISAIYSPLQIHLITLTLPLYYLSTLPLYSTLLQANWTQQTVLLPVNLRSGVIGRKLDRLTTVDHDGDVDVDVLGDVKFYVEIGVEVRLASKFAKWL